MSLPTAKAPPAQLSIRSFFQAKTPKYASPPSSRDSNPPPTQSESPPVAQPLTLPPLPSTLPPEATIRPIVESDIPPLRRINSLLLQVSYPDTFYQKATESRASSPFSRVITWTHDGEEPKIIGGIVTHVEPDVDISASQVQQNLYVRSICLLSPYRSLGLMSAALEHVIATAVSDKSLDLRSVTAHVWTENEEGLSWYDRRGFTRQQVPVKGYYLKLRPDSAWLVRRDVGASVRSSLPATNGVAASRPIATSTTAAIVNLPRPPTSGPPSSKSTPPPPPQGQRPNPVSGQSYQNQRPEMEWNDLPADMAPTMSAIRRTGSETASAASSRSSSTAPRKKKDRSYPTTAFGG